MSEGYVVQQPNSNSNKTKKYRVIKHQDWLNWLDLPPLTRGVIAAVGEFDDYGPAKRLCNRLNDEIREGSR